MTPRIWLLAPGLVFALWANGAPVFNVKDYGASGRKADDARPALQKAIEACAAAGGGTVRLPPGEYTSGTLRLRSRVCVEIEAGATLFASPDAKAYDYGQIPTKAALFFGEDLENVALCGQGTVDGQSEYERRPDDFESAFDHKTLMQSSGKPILRPFPKGFPQRQVFPHLVWLGRSTNVQVTGLKLLRSPNWSIALYGCERAVFDRLYVYTSLKEAVWADGIDLDGCRDVTISNCAIETGDDCIALISENSWGPALACENITVTNCRLSSASAAVKFSEGNRLAIRHVRISHCVLTNVNRGFVFLALLGGEIADVTLSDLTVACRRFDWFWAGDGQPFHFRIKRVSEVNHEPRQPDEPFPGVIRNVTIRNVIARGQGSSPVQGHPESWLDGIRFENVKLALSADRAAPFDQARHAMHFRWARNVTLKNIAVSWEEPALPAWQSALCFEDVRGLELEGFAGRAAWPEHAPAAVVFNHVSDALLRNSRALDGTGLFLEVRGDRSGNIRLQGNDLGRAKLASRLAPEVPAGALKILDVP
jgi:polygalacturonase